MGSSVPESVSVVIPALNEEESIGEKRVIDICEEILRRELDIGWDIRARVDSVDRELLKKLARAHCERIHFGAETETESRTKSPQDMMQ